MRSTCPMLTASCATVETAPVAKFRITWMTTTTPRTRQKFPCERAQLRRIAAIGPRPSSTMALGANMILMPTHTMSTTVAPPSSSVKITPRPMEPAIVPSSPPEPASTTNMMKGMSSHPMAMRMMDPTPTITA
ncbi:hypothetical protein ACFPRL_11060 [Pseudoclavibacter helvolus]